MIALKKEQAKLAQTQILLKSQEQFVLSIRLSLAQLNKQFQATQSQLKREFKKNEVLAEESIRYEQ
jgi:hypothetical protein